MKKLKNILKDDSAQGILEYVMLLAVVAAIVMVFGPKIKGIITSLTANVESNTGNVMNNLNGN